jgi:hypothetical protein
VIAVNGNEQRRSPEACGSEADDRAERCGE